jgi:hypothetical protein
MGPAVDAPSHRKARREHLASVNGWRRLGGGTFLGKTPGQVNR